MIYTANAACDGYAVGKVYGYRPFAYTPEERTIPPQEIPAALETLRSLRDAADRELQDICDRMEDPDKAKVFAAHREILQDEAMVEEMEDAIADGSAVDFAISTVFDQFIRLLSKTDNALIRERTADLEDVKKRLLRLSVGEPERNLSVLPEPVIVVTHDLLPSDTATIDRKNVLAIVTEIGGQTSHSAIIARSYGIPAVLGLDHATEVLRDGETIIVDACKGRILVDEGDEEEYRRKQADFLNCKALEAAYLPMPARTADGTDVAIGMNIGALNAGEAEMIPYCDLCGLFRTEFLYMDSDHLPTEEEQFAAYRRTLEAFRGKPVTLRTLDIGGDKTLPYFTLPKEDNPFLGSRALRLCLANRPLFLTQLRAALRAAVYGELWLMFPMVGSIGDIQNALAALEEARQSLESDGVPFGNCKVGIMVEIPAIALVAREAAALVDFASIGTNDLMQYLSAADRQNPAVEPYYAAALPAALRLIGQIAQAFGDAGKTVSVCGEMGGDPLLAPVLVGLGLRKLSMSASRMAKVKRAICGRTLSTLQKLAEDALREPTAEKILARLQSEEDGKELQNV